MQDLKKNINIQHKRHDRRIMAIVLTLFMVVGLGILLNSVSEWFPVEWESTSIYDPLPLDTTDVVQHKKVQKLSLDFKKAVSLLHLKKYTAALPLWQHVVKQAPWMPEAQVNLGFTLLGLGRSSEAESAFEAALVIQPTQSNTLYGLAMAQAAQRRFVAAITNMQAYIKLASKKSTHTTRAQTLIAQWQQATAANSQ